MNQEDYPSAVDMQHVSLLNNYKLWCSSEINPSGFTITLFTWLLQAFEYAMTPAMK